jgi:hypothetical protein
MKYHLTAALAAILLAACATPTTADLAPPADAPVDPAAIETGSFVAAGWLASSLPEIADALAAGEITSLELTEAYIARIEAIDRAGPRLQSIRMVNPDALAQAAASDARRAAGAPLGPLDGVPIVLKDNIETLDPMPTTAGLSPSRTETKTVPESGRRTPAPSWDLANARPKSESIPMTSPVDFISGPSRVSTPGKRANGKTASFTEIWP